MSFLRKAFQKALDVVQGEATPLNQRPSQGKTDAGGLKRTLDVLAANAFDIEKGRIDYLKIRTDPEYANYQAHAATLQNFDPRATSRDEQLAFWLNIYNALTIDAVISFGIKETVREIPRLGFFRKAAYIINGHIFSLEDIEHGVLRHNQRHPAYPMPQFGQDDPRKAYVVSPLEPRVHFAMTCASRSCPPIAFYDGAKIQDQLKKATISFVTGGGCDLGEDKNSLVLSEIFKWYTVDFGGESNMKSFISSHHEDENIKRLLSNPSTPITYSPYNWNLNK
jgi:hypothetical protein